VTSASAARRPVAPGGRRGAGLLAAAGMLAALLSAAPASAQSPIDVHAHRGGPYAEGRPVHPENTMPAFRAAARDGFVLEVDTELTKDGVPVVLHDATLDRTTNCSGPVKDVTLAELQARCRADVLGLPETELPSAPAPEPVPIPTLAELLAFARDSDARVNLEIKNLPTEGSFDPTPGFATKVLDAVDAAGFQRSRLIIQSFWPPNLDLAEQRGFTTSLLTLPQTNQGAPEYAKGRGYEWISPSGPLDPALVSRAHALGLRVVPYTLDSEDQLRTAAANAVDELITNDSPRAARVLQALGPKPAPVPPPPSDDDCRKARASRTLEPILAPARGDGPRVFAMQFKQDARHVVTYAAFRTKIECTIREWVVPHLARDRPNVVAFNEDVGLATIATGSRGRTAREVFTDPSRGPSCTEQGAPCGALGALTAVKASYGRETAAYQTRFERLDPVSGAFVSATDTFARGFMQTFSDMARRYGVYILGSNNQAPFRESTDPQEIAAFADPDLPEPPSSVFVATAPQVYNEVFLWAPRDIRRAGPLPLRNVVASNKKVPLTSIEQQLQLTPGPATGPDAIENVEPYQLPGTEARLAFATSLPAFVFGPPADDPCADVARNYMRCLDKLGANVVIQDEANPGKWASYTAKDSPDRGAWQTMSWMTSTWRHVSDPAVRFAYNVTPHLVGNLADLPFDGQTAITQRGLSRGPGCHYVGSGRFLAGTDPETFAIGGEDLRVPPFAGPKTEFVALAPWVTPDAERPELQQTANELSPDGNGKLENDYLETALVADLPFPPDPGRGSCETRSATAATSGRRARKPRLRITARPRRARAGRRVRYRFRVTSRGRPVRRARVLFAGASRRTGRRGRATIVRRVHKRGRRPARAYLRGYRSGRTVVRLVR